MNQTEALQYFNLLKKEVEQSFQEKHPECSRRIYEWTAADIRTFQDDIEEGLNERLSQRWFYTHLKPLHNEKIPRVDMLHILSRYVGFPSWDDFVSNKEPAEDIVENAAPRVLTQNAKKRYRYFAILILFLVLIIVGRDLYFVRIQSTDQYVFQFYDKDLNEPMMDHKINVWHEREKESPRVIESDSMGRIYLEAQKESIRLKVDVPYYKSKTIDRNINGKGGNEIIFLERDDYSVLIHQVSIKDIEDFARKRKQLGRIIADDAQIFQITKENRGMEIYNKEEFIDRLTLPVNRLRNIEIVESIYKDGQIINLRFIYQK